MSSVDEVFHALTGAIADGNRRRGLFVNRDPRVITLACAYPRLLGQDGTPTGERDDNGTPLVAFRLSQAQAMLDQIVGAAMEDAGQTP